MPLILTAELDPATDEYFNKLRKQLFPPALNVVPAHITLFHHLPNQEGEAIITELQRTAGEHFQLSLAVTGLRNLGRGVAFTLDSPDLARLRRQLSEKWQDWLMEQDRQPFKPHVTVQNKVSPETARATLAGLQAGWQIRAALVVGLSLWEYRNGPWNHLQTFPFRHDGLSAEGTVHYDSADFPSD